MSEGVRDEGSSPDSPLAAGTVVSHYRIQGVLGRGGMGIVYRALDLNLEREVALKCVRPDRDDLDHRRRLLREARAASRLTHPNIVTVHEVLEVGEAPAIVMELIEGRSLRELLRSEASLPQEDLLRYAEGLAGGLAAAHAQGILHRDVNPNNVLITRDGHALLTDFGLMRSFAPTPSSEDSTTSTASVPGQIVGTPGYLSPEQVRGQPLDPRTDIFSLGTVLYEMCTGSRAFPLGSEVGMIEAILNKEPVAACRLNPAVSPELERIIAKALAKRPDERYQSATEMATDLRALRRRVESGSLSMPLVQEPPRPRRSALLAAGLAGAGLLAASLLAFAAWRWATPSPGVTPLPTSQPRQLTTGRSLDAQPSISPDGSFVAYASRRGGDLDVWIADTGSGQPLRLTENPGADDSPSWFPDGSTLAFVSDRSGGEAVWKVPRLGGPATMLLSDAVDPAISPDATRIAFVRSDAAGRLRIWVSPLDQPGAARQVTTQATGFWDHRQPAWSPDGEQLCFVDFNNLWVVPAAGGVPHPLTTGQARNRNPAWTADGRWIYFSTVVSGTRALARVPASGGALERVTLGTADEGEPSVCRNGRHLAYATRIEEPRLVRVDLISGARTTLAGERGLLSPAFGPDGRQVYYLLAHPTQPAPDLWAVPVGRAGAGPSPATRMTRIDGGMGTYSLSPDGRLLAYHRAQLGRRDLWTVPLAGGIPTQLTNDAAADLQPAWSPDGAALAFVSDRDGGQHIWVARMNDGRLRGELEPVTRGEGSDEKPAWSPDGSHIALLRALPNESEVWIVAPGGEPRRVTHGASALGLVWLPDGERLLVSGTWGGRRVLLREVDRRSGASIPFRIPIDFGEAGALGDFAIAPDGRSLVYLEEAARGEVWVLETDKGRF